MQRGILAKRQIQRWRGAGSGKGAIDGCKIIPKLNSGLYFKYLEHYILLHGYGSAQRVRMK